MNNRPLPSKEDMKAAKKWWNSLSAKQRAGLQQHSRLKDDIDKTHYYLSVIQMPKDLSNLNETHWPHYE